MEHLHNGPFLVQLLFFILIIQMLSSYNAKADSNVSCMESERRALLKIKDGLIDESNRLSSWKGEDCCTWEGVGCNNLTGHVVKLDLHNPISLDSNDPNSPAFDTTTGRLGGQIDPSILDLVQLNYLDVSLNDFSDSPIPAFLGSLKNLRYLNLSGADYSGEIPHQLGNLSNLQYLIIGDSPDEQNGGFFNDLSAKNLEWITRLSSLKSLDLSGVNLDKALDWLYSANMIPSLSSLILRYSGIPNILFPSIPSANNLTSLTSLDLGSNYLNSTFPLWLSNLTNLVNLQMDNDLFHGPIPDVFQKFTSLTVLNFSTNSFNSSLPASFCNLKSLTQMNLEHNHIQGSLPLFFGNLTKLTELDLEGNKINGTIPGEIGQLKQLTYLNLASNYLQGSIPSSFGQLSALEILILSRNQLSGIVSSILEQLTKLQQLEVSHNSLTGALSELTFAKLKELQVLSISYNYFLTFNVSSQWIPPFQLREILMDSILVGPQFPPWLQTQKKVDVLSMQNASISGTIPEWFETVYSGVRKLYLSRNSITGRIPEFKDAGLTDRWIVLHSNNFSGPFKPFPSDITGLDLSDNFLSGPILLFPANMSDLSLAFLNLDDNYFTGDVPQYLCNILTLQVISLANNLLSGKIPECLGSLQLAVLNLATNSLSGRIPSTFQSLDLLFLLHLNGNKLYGELPSSLQSMKSLLTLDLGENELQGTIPEWIGKQFSSLQFLRLEHNNFSGDIPQSFCRLSFLQVLNLAENRLSGHIPPCFKNLSMMVSKDKGSDHSSYPLYQDVLMNINKGRELEYSRNLKYLKSIVLSGNEIIGEIPNELMELEGLQILNLSNNHLSGRIPDKIGNLDRLESLDLAVNQLLGPIPQSLANIDTLSYLNLSFNNLEGRIPSGNHFDTLNDGDPSIFEGNNGLCGKPLQKSCPGDTDTPSEGNGDGVDHKGDDDDDGFEFFWFYAGIAPGFAVGLLGVFCVFYLNKSWRDKYIGLLENTYDRFLVAITLKIYQLNRRFN